MCQNLMQLKILNLIRGSPMQIFVVNFLKGKNFEKKIINKERKLIMGSAFREI